LKDSADHLKAVVKFKFERTKLDCIFKLNGTKFDYCSNPISEHVSKAIRSKGAQVNRKQRTKAKCSLTKKEKERSRATLI